MAEHKIVKKDGVDYIVDEVRSGKVVVGLAPTVKAVDLDELMAILEPDVIFKLAYRQIRTDHKNLVRAKFNGKGKSALAVVNAIANGGLTVEQIQEEMLASKTDFTTAATNLLQTDPDPTAIHWDVL